MAPKGLKRGASAIGSAAPKAKAAANIDSSSKSRKVSSARQDAAMQAMTVELNNRRGSDELAFIAEECGQASESRMICYAQCVKLRKKRENERFFHRNNAGMTSAWKSR